MICSVTDDRRARLLVSWRAQMENPKRRRPHRRQGVLYVLVKQHPVQGLVRLRNLQFLVLFDELAQRSCPAVRLSCHGARRVPHGVFVGGPEGCRFSLDLSMCPSPTPRRQQLDLKRPDFLRLALSLDRFLDRASSTPNPRHRNLKLPKFWAGFAPNIEPELTADGPEAAWKAKQQFLTLADLLRRFRREHEGLVLFPIDWVSHHWGKARAIYADIAQFPRRQVFALQNVERDLRGFRGAVEFDFFSRRSFEPAPRRGPVSFGVMQDDKRQRSASIFESLNSQRPSVAVCSEAASY